MNKFKPKFTLGFIFDSKLERVLLLKKKVTNPERGETLKKLLDGKLNGIGGGCELGESAHQTMSRECKEECGLTIPPENWIDFAYLDAEFGYIYCFYIVTDKIYSYKKNEQEELGIYLIDKEQLDPENTDSNPFFTPNYRLFERMANLDYLIPIALNHAKGLDKTAKFEIKEINGISW